MVIQSLTFSDLCWCFLLQHFFANLQDKMDQKHFEQFHTTVKTLAAECFFSISDGFLSYEVVRENSYVKAFRLWTFSPVGSLKRPRENSDLKSFQRDVLWGRQLCSSGNITSTPKVQKLKLSPSASSQHFRKMGTSFLQWGSRPLYLSGIG